MTIFVKFRDQILLVDRNYLFYFQKNNRLNSKNDFFIYVIDVNFVAIQIRNVTNQSIIVSRNFKFDKLRNYDKKNYYLVNFDNRHLIVKFINN